MRRGGSYLFYLLSLWPLLGQAAASFAGRGPMIWWGEDEWARYGSMHDTYVAPKAGVIAGGVALATILLALGAWASPGRWKKEVGTILLWAASLTATAWCAYAWWNRDKSMFAGPTGPYWDWPHGLCDLVAMTVLGLWLIQNQRREKLSA